MMRLSVVVPVLDEAETIADHLDSLAPLRAGGAEVIVVDGGSADDTLARARRGADRVLAAARGRARQMNAGAAAATGDVLLFLHADTRLPPRGRRAHPRGAGRRSARVGPLRRAHRRRAAGSSGWSRR